MLGREGSRLSGSEAAKLPKGRGPLDDGSPCVEVPCRWLRQRLLLRTGTCSSGWTAGDVIGVARGRDGLVLRVQPTAGHVVPGRWGCARPRRVGGSTDARRYLTGGVKVAMLEGWS